MESKRSFPKWMIPFFSGGIAGTVAKTAIAPLERVKILFQIRSIHYPYQGVIKTLTSIVKNEGILGLWKGNNATVVRIFPYAAIQFFTYENIKKLLNQKSQKNQWVITVGNLTAGGIAGAASVICTYPLDLVRVQLAIAVKKKQYNGVIDCIVTIYRNQGLVALYRGIGPTLMGIVPYAATNFATYEALKVFAAKTMNRDINQTPIPVKLMCGGFAGAIGQTVAYPLDVVRRQMQTSGFAEGHGTFHKNTLDALRTIVAKEGIYGLFRGLSINYLRVGPQVAISFTTYEAVKKFLEEM